MNRNAAGRKNFQRGSANGSEVGLASATFRRDLLLQTTPIPEARVLIRCESMYSMRAPTCLWTIFPTIGLVNGCSEMLTPTQFNQPSDARDLSL